MANKKISQLPAAESGSFEGTNLLPIVQGNETKKMSLEQLFETLYITYNGWQFITSDMLDEDGNYTLSVENLNKLIIVYLDANLYSDAKILVPQELISTDVSGKVIALNILDAGQWQKQYNGPFIKSLTLNDVLTIDVNNESFDEVVSGEFLTMVLANDDQTNSSLLIPTSTGIIYDNGIYKTANKFLFDKTALMPKDVVVIDSSGPLLSSYKNKILFLNAENVELSFIGTDVFKEGDCFYYVADSVGSSIQIRENGAVFKSYGVGVPNILEGGTSEIVLMRYSQTDDGLELVPVTGCIKETVNVYKSPARYFYDSIPQSTIITLFDISADDIMNFAQDDYVAFTVNNLIPDGFYIDLIFKSQSELFDSWLENYDAYLSDGGTLIPTNVNYQNSSERKLFNNIKVGAVAAEISNGNNTIQLEFNASMDTGNPPVTSGNIKVMALIKKFPN